MNGTIEKDIVMTREKDRRIEGEIDAHKSGDSNTYIQTNGHTTRMSTSTTTTTTMKPLTIDVFDPFYVGKPKRHIE